MFCPKCGAQLGPQARFCASSGTSLGAPREDAKEAAQSRPGRFHRFFLVALMMWTALVVGVVVTSSVIVGNPQANPGAVLGWTLGVGVTIVVWTCGAIVLGVLATATKPSPSVLWPRTTKWLSAGLTVLASFGRSPAHVRFSGLFNRLHPSLSPPIWRPTAGTWIGTRPR